MPYAPGIQDISGQLLGEGMTRASNVRAQARSDFGRSIADTLIGGIKQYQQNENFTSQSLAKFTERMQDREFNKYVNNILADDSNKMGVPESVKTAFRNAQTGKLKPNEASTLATIAQDYSERKKASEESNFKRMQTALAYAQAQGVLAKASAPPVGQRMTQEQFLGLPSGMDATAVPAGDGSGDVIVKSISGRAPEKQDITPVNIGGETILIDKNTGREVRRIPNTSAIPAGFEMVPGTSAQPSPVPMAAAMPVPASLSQFMPARSMAPADLSLAARQGGMATQPVPGASPAAIEAMNAVQAAQGAPRMAAAQPVAPVPAGETLRATPGIAPMAIRPIAGSPAAIEAQQKTQAAQKARDTLQGNIDTTMDTIKKIERVASKYSVGSPGVANPARVVGQFLPASTDVKALLQTLEGNIAFDALRNLKASDTSLGQIAIKELELLKASKGTFEQAVSYPLFIENLNRFKIQTEYAGKKLQALNSALEKGLTEPTKEFYELEKQQNAALKALEKTPEQRLKDMGIKVKLL